MSDQINIFEQASRQALRFNYRGVIAVEDLWNLKLIELNDIGVALYKQQQQQATVSFIEDQPKANEELNLKLEIVKHIINVKKADADAARQEADRRARKQQLLDLINQKENEQLGSLSLDQLRQQLAEL